MQGRIRVLHRLQVGCKRVWMVLEKGFTEIASSRGGRAGHPKTTDGGTDPG